MFVRDGFHVWAMVFGPLWLIAKRLWLALLGWIVVVIGIEVGLRSLGVGRPTVALVGHTGSMPGLPSNVVTPASHLSSTAGFPFSHFRAASLPDMPSLRMEPITSFSVAMSKVKLVRNLPTLGHSVV